MGWETRRGRSYYYRKERDGARVRSVYVGAGPLAHAVAALGARDGEARRTARRTVEAEAVAVDAAWRALDAYVRLAVRAHLVAAGFRLHRRQWRRRRDRAAFQPPPPEPRSTAPMPKKRPTTPALPAALVPVRPSFLPGGAVQFAATSGEPADVAAVEALVNAAAGPRPPAEAVLAVRAWVCRDGVMLEAERLADKARAVAYESWQNAALAEMARAGLRDLRERMGYGTAPPVERLLIEAACTAWLFLTAEERRYVAAFEGEGGRFLLAPAEAADRRLTRAQGRFLRSVETLERVRALQTVTAVRAGEATPRERALARAEIARREAARGRAGSGVPALAEHAGDGAASPAEAPALVIA